MDRDELQARWILAQGWLPTETLKAALKRARQRGHELVDLLESAGQLDRAGAEKARQAAARALERRESRRNDRAAGAREGSATRQRRSGGEVAGAELTKSARQRGSAFDLGPVDLTRSARQGQGPESGRQDLTASARRSDRPGGEAALNAASEARRPGTRRLKAEEISGATKRRSSTVGRPGTQRMRPPTEGLARESRTALSPLPPLPPASLPSPMPALGGGGPPNLLLASGRDAAGLAAMRAAVKPPSAGRRFGPYELLDELGRGAMGVVMRARHKEAGAEVALKFMQNKTDNPRAVKRFEKEAKTLRALKNEHIVRITDFGVQDGTLFYAMEVIRGKDLKAIVSDSLRETGEVPPWEDTVSAMLGIAKALVYCHAHGVIHRDVKPGNVIVEESSGRPVLVDFGLLKKEKMEGESTDSQALTKSNEAVGTPAFMAPEQFVVNGKFGYLGPNSDVWGWGATLYFALTGEPPFKKKTVVETFRAILDETPTAPHKLNPKVPEWLLDVLEGCLTRHSDQRLTMREVVSLLETQGADRGAGGWAPWMVPASLALAALLIVAALIFVWPRGPRVLELRTVPNLVGAATIELAGRLSQGEVRVRAGGVSTRCDAAGLFKIQVPLREGENEVELRAEDSGVVLLRQAVRRDSEGPTIQVADRHESGAILVKEDGRFRGVVSDASGPCELTFEGRVVEVEPGGGFAITVALEDGVAQGSLVARDLAGNTTSLDLELVTEGRAAERALLGRARSLLARAEVWREARLDEQDAIGGLILRGLGREYESLPARDYECGRWRFRIQRFRHRASGAELHLIPGGTREVEWWSDPNGVLIAAIYQLMAEGESLPVLRFALKTPLTASIRLNLLKSFPELVRSADVARLDRSLTAIQLRWAQGPLSDIDVANFERDAGSLANMLGRFFSSDDRRRGALRRFAKNQLESFRQENKRRVTQERVGPFLMGAHELSKSSWSVFGKVPEFASITSEVAIVASYPEVEQWLARAGGGLRLPSFIEWQHAASGGAGADLPWGELDRSPDYVWAEENSRGSFRGWNEHMGKANAFGLVDAVGHMEEWAEPLWGRWAAVMREAGLSEGYLEGAQGALKRKRAMMAMGGHIHRPLMLCRPEIYGMRDGAAARDGVRVDSLAWRSAQRGLRVARSLEEILTGAAK